MKTIALYARVSSEQQAQQATIESQVAALEERAKTDGCTVLPGDIYLDEGYSGATLIRPSLERLRDRIAEGKIDILYVHSPDRLARRYAYQVLLLEEFTRHGTSTLFVHGPAGDSPEERLLVQVQGMIAEYERANIAERCRRGKLHRARQGQLNSMSGAPYGYLYVKKTENEDARYEVLDDEAAVVKQMFDWFVFEQLPIGQIANRLNQQNVPTRRKAPQWHRSTVWGILQNPAYMGMAAFGKTEVVDRQPQLVRPMRGSSTTPRRATSTRDKAPEEWIYIPTPAVVSKEVFAAAKEQLERNRQLSKRNGRGNRYLLQGLVKCAKCGYAYYGKTVSRAKAKGKERWAYYRCTGTDGHRFAEGRVCSNKQVRVDQLDGYVWETVQALLQEPERLLQEWSRRDQSDGDLADLRTHRDEMARYLATQENRMQRLLDAYEAGVVELDELTQRVSRARARTEQAKRSLEQAEQELSSVFELRAVADRLDAFTENIRHRLGELDWQERQSLIRMLVSRVEIDEEGATVVFRVPRLGERGPLAGGGGGAKGSTNMESFQLCRGSGFAASGQYLPALRIRLVGPRVASEACDRRGNRRPFCR